MTDVDYPSRSIPEPIKREVRQRCGFGCVVCGVPICDYEHMDGWAETHIHDAASITMLCNLHHRERTAGLLPIAAVREADANPYNLAHGESSAHALHFSGETCTVVLGTNVVNRTLDGIDDRMTAIMIDDVEIVGFRLVDGQLLMNMMVFDDSNAEVLRVDENQLVHSVNSWDITFIGRTLTIREGRGQFLLEVEFRPPGQIVINRARLVLNGAEIVVTSEFVLLVNDGTLMSGGRFFGARYALAINSPSAVGGVGMSWPVLNRMTSYDPVRRRRAVSDARKRITRSAAARIAYEASEHADLGAMNLPPRTLRWGVGPLSPDPQISRRAIEKWRNQHKQ